MFSRGRQGANPGKTSQRQKHSAAVMQPQISGRNSGDSPDRPAVEHTNASVQWLSNAAPKKYGVASPKTDGPAVRPQNKREDLGEAVSLGKS